MEGSVLNLFFLLLYVNGRLCGTDVEVVLVKEGDSVTLHTGLTELKNGHVIEWSFGPKQDVIARINQAANDVPEYPNEKFRDGIKLNDHNGDLTIRNIRMKHFGVYEVSNEHSANHASFKKYFNIIAVPGDADGGQSVSALQGDSVTLQTDVPELHNYNIIKWKFDHQNTIIAELNRMAKNKTKYDGTDGRFRHRLEIDFLTGSLTISHIGMNHSGIYEADISSSRHTIHKTFILTVTGEKKSLTVVEGESVTLESDIEIEVYDLILWVFEDTLIAEIFEAAHVFYVYDGTDERFRGKLQLNHTGSLIIKQSKTTNSGLYELKISSSRHTVLKKFTLTVTGQCLSSGAVAGICTAVLVVVLVVAASVNYCYIKKRGSSTAIQIEERNYYQVIGHVTADHEMHTSDL